MAYCFFPQSPPFYSWAHPTFSVFFLLRDFCFFPELFFPIGFMHICNCSLKHFYDGSFKYFQIILTFVFFLLACITFFPIQFNILLVLGMTRPEPLGILLWDTASYLSFLFYLAFLDKTAVGEGEDLPHYYQVGVEVHVTHSASADTEGCTLLVTVD